MYRLFFKRLIDVLVSILLLSASSPILLITIIMLSISNNGKVFFTQLRPGKSSKIFRIIKFKTMNDARNEKGELLPDQLRITKFGQFVRKTSIDELPQLINVLKGEMSLIGPRPLLPEYLPLYTENQARRHEIRPGITGWAQVNGRNELTWAQKFNLDVFYIENLTFALDLKIVYLTFLKVIKQEGVSKKGEATTEAFNGRN